MVKRELTADMIEAGVRMLELLDRHRFRVRAALWLYFPESERWRFVVASPEVRTHGRRRAYLKIGTLAGKVPGGDEIFGPGAVTALEDNDRLVVSLRRSNSAGPGLRGCRLTGAAVNGTLIEDAYIYRVT